MFTILILTFIQGHTDRTHGNNQCSIISEPVQAIPITLAVKIVRALVWIVFSQFGDHSRSQLCLKLHTFNLYYNSHISDSIEAMAFKRGLTVD